VVNEIRELGGAVSLAGLTGSVFMEFSIPRVGRRIDAVQVGETTFDRSSLDQVWDTQNRGRFWRIATENTQNTETTEKTARETGVDEQGWEEKEKSKSSLRGRIIGGLHHDSPGC
jgi:hypothetical protein